MAVPANQSFPAGGTWFDTLRKSFSDVPVDASHDNAISTTDFLEASESLSTLFEVLGSVAFTPVKNDMIGNIKKIRDRQLLSPADSGTVQSLVRSELATKKHTATEGLLWLTRGLAFTAAALRHNVSNPSEELATSFKHSYSQTLSKHHSFLIKPIFSAAMAATPYKADFYKKLGSVDDRPKVDEALNQYLTSLEKVVSILTEFTASKDAKWK